MSIKLERMNNLFVKEISSILHNEIKDDNIKFVSVTGCEITNDLSFAKVYFTSISNLTKEQIEKEMNEASGFIRTELASKIDIRIIPKLKFVYDESIEYGNRIESILQELKNEQES